MAQRNLSKSKLIAYRQCAKRVWLEVHKPELRKDTASAEARMGDRQRTRPARAPTL